MRLSTRLLLVLLPAVALVMASYGIWALQQRESTLIPEMQRETETYATALAVALEHALDEPQVPGLQSILDEVSREPKIYGILLYSRAGQPIAVSAPLRATDAAPSDALSRVLSHGATARLEREIEGQDVFSVLRPIRGPQGEVIGALEVAQPLTFVEGEKAFTRKRFLLNTLTLLLLLTVLSLWLVRRFVAQPLEKLVAAARALGRGELAYRIEQDPGAGELSELAREFNRMADGLGAARADLLREAEERLALERRLRETEKLAAVGSLAAGVAHEIGAPLSVVAGRAEVLLKRHAGQPDLERSLRIVVDQIGRITMIVRNLLDFARRREPRLEPMDLGLVLDGTLEFLEGELARTGTELEREGPRRIRVQGDRDLLHQVFLNLFLNALHAAESVDGARRIRVRVLEPGGPAEPVVVEVEDSGPGIPEPVLPKIFEPFFTTKPAGTGLGLAVTRGIVEEHGGRLEVEAHGSALGGATFRVVLPSASREASNG